MALEAESPLAESPLAQSPLAQSPPALAPAQEAAQPLPAQSGPLPLAAAEPERQTLAPPAGQRAREPVRLTLPRRRDRS